MKSLKIFLTAIALFVVSSTQAQVSLNVNIGTPPLWGPSGYAEVGYYYLPDVESFYDVRSSMFIYYSGGSWVHHRELPVRYRNYDLYGGYKVVMSDYHGNAPYTHFKEYKTKYGKGYRGRGQKTIGQRPGKGNSGQRMHSEGNSRPMKHQGNAKMDKNMKNDHDHGKGPGKDKKK